MCRSGNIQLRHQFVSPKGKGFQEIFRILKTGGRFVISDIVSDREVPVSMKRDKILWSECVSGAVTEEEFSI